MLDFEYIEPRDFLDKNWQTACIFLVFQFGAKLQDFLPTTFETFYSEAKLIVELHL